MTVSGEAQRPNGSSAGGTNVGKVRSALWFAMFMPYIHTTPKTVAQVGTLGPVDVLRGVGGALIIAAALGSRAIRARRRMGFGSTELWLLGFVVISFASGLWSISPRSSVFQVIPYMTVAFAGYLIVGLYDSYQECLVGVASVCHFLMALTLVELALLHSQAYGFVDPTQLAPDQAANVERLGLVTPSIAANLLGVPAGVAMLSLVLGIVPKWMQRVRAWWWLIFLGEGTLLVFTRSRIVTGLIVIAALYAFFRQARRNSAVAAIVFIALSVFASVVWYYSSARKIPLALGTFALRGQDSHGLSTLTGRTEVWAQALPVWRLHYWRGWGYYSGHRIATARYSSLLAGHSNLDSTWIEMLVDVGVLGMALLALYTLGVLIRTLRLAGSRHGAFGLLVVLVIFGLSFINPGIDGATISLALFLVVGAAARSQTHSSTCEEDLLPPPDHRPLPAKA